MPSDYVFCANFSVTIINVPTDLTKVYMVTLINNAGPTNSYYRNLLSALDTTSACIYGAAATYVAPKFNGAVSESPLATICQSFSNIPMNNAALSAPSRVILSCVASNL